MSSFFYRARDKPGALVTGSLDAASIEESEAALDKMGLIPIKVAKQASSFRFPDIRNLFEKIPQQEIIMFNRQLATLFGAGVPLSRALFTLERQATTAGFSQVVKTIREDIESGVGFAASLRKHPRVFPELYCSLIEAGGGGGGPGGGGHKSPPPPEENTGNKGQGK